MISESIADEEWRPVPGYEGLYEVSSLGRVRSLDRVVTSSTGRVVELTGIVLKPYENDLGYRSVQLSRAGKPRKHFVHALVLKAFKGAPGAGELSRHLDSDPRNNQVSNLAWGTQTENMGDMVAQRRHHRHSQTHCSRGHELSGNNLVKSSSNRKCRACVNTRGALWARGKEVTAEKFTELANERYKRYLNE